MAAPVAVAVVTALLAASWSATYALGGAGTTAPHWFYLPIMAAAARFGVPGALMSALVSGVLAGPLMPEDVAAASSQPLSDWLSRAGFFVAIGLLMATLVTRAQTAAQRERRAAEQQRAVIESVTHEFRTPLTVIRGSAEVLTTRDLEPDIAGEFRRMLRTAVGRLNDLVDLVVATAESFAPAEDVYVRATVVRRAVEDVVVSLDRLGAKRRVRVEAERGAVVVGLPSLLTLCLRAVIENALKFSPPDTSVHVEIRVGEHSTEVTVRDEGPGIPHDVARQSMEAGFASRRADAAVGGGLGLGIYAAARAVERLDGTIVFEPGETGGTRVVLTFPSQRGDRA